MGHVWEERAEATEGAAKGDTSARFSHRARLRLHHSQADSAESTQEALPQYWEMTKPHLSPVPVLPNKSWKQDLKASNYFQVTKLSQNKDEDYLQKYK